MHLAPMAGGKHRGGHHVGGGIHDHTHRDEGHPMERGNLRDRRTFHVDRRSAGSPKGSFFGGRGTDRFGTREKPSAGHTPLRTHGCGEGCGEGFAPMPSGGEGAPIRGNDFTGQANISSLEPGIEGAGHTPADERRGAGFDECARRIGRRCAHAAHRDESAVIEHQTSGAAPLDGTEGPRLRCERRDDARHIQCGVPVRLSVRKVASAHSGKYAL